MNKKTRMRVADGINITRLDYGLFYVDIVESEDEYEAWLLKKDYGVSSLMFGCPKHQECDNSDWSFERFVYELVEPNLLDEQVYYMKEFGD